MAKVAEDITFEPITEGVIADSTVSYYVSPKNSVSSCENFNNDILGVLTYRIPLGLQFVPEATNNISAVLFQPAALANRIYYQVNQSLLWRDAGTPTTATTYTSIFQSNYQPRYSIIQGNLLMTCGSLSGIKYTTGASAPVAIAGISGTPTDIDLIDAGFGGRIWYGSSTNANNRVYYTDVIPAAGVASTTGTSQYLTINANNGDYVTGLIQGQQVLYAFTTNGIFRIYNTQSQDNVPLAFVGAPNQESIAKGTDGIYFYHSTGFYKLTDGGTVQLISNRIKSIIPRYTNPVRVWSVGDFVYFSFYYDFAVGGGSNLGSKVFRYTISTQTWTVYNFFKNIIYATTTSLDRSNTRRTYLFGSSGGANATFASIFEEQERGDGSISTSSASGDDNSEIQIIGSFETNWENFGMESHIKQINGIAYPSSNATGFDVAYQVDNANPSHWIPIGKLSDKTITLFKDFVSVPFNRIRFRVMGQKKNPYSGGTFCSIGSPTIMKLTDKGYE